MVEIHETYDLYRMAFHCNQIKHSNVAILPRRTETMFIYKQQQHFRTKANRPLGEEIRAKLITRRAIVKEQ